MVNPDPAFWRGKRVLVTGHTGFKGAWLVLWLRALGAEVHGYSLAPEGDRNLFEAARVAEGIGHRIGDVRDLPGLRDSLAACGPEIVFHLAAQSLVRESYRTPIETFATNIMGTAHLLEAVRSRPEVKAVVVVTTDKCYANDESGGFFREDAPLGGKDPYSASKAGAEIVAAAMRASFFGAGTVAIATVRAGNVIGGGDWSADRLIPDCMRAFERGAAVEIRSPRAIRPWQHVLEPLAGYLRVAESLCERPDAAARAWNFGPLEAGHRDVGYVVGRAAAAWGEGAAVTLNPAATGAFAEAGCLKLDAGAASNLLDWHPRLDLDESIDWTVSWYRQAHQGQGARALCAQQIARYNELGKR